MLRASLVVAAAVLLAGVATAAPVSCDSGIPDVLALNSNPDPGCTLGPLLFTDWAVASSNASAHIGILNSSAMVGNSVNLVFEVFPQTGPLGIKLNYTVTGGMIGVDMVMGTSSGTASITEVVCSGPFVGGLCSGTELAAYVVDRSSPPSSMIASRSFGGSYSPVYIQKDIQILSGGSMSDFTNSHEVPEPATYLLMGAGLLAVGFVRRWHGKA